MRIIYLITAVIVLVLAASLWGYFYLKEQADTITGLLEELEKGVEAGDWRRAGRIKEELQLSWDKAGSIFPIMIDHAHIHDLTISLTRIYSLVDIREAALLIPEIQVARRLIQEIPEQEKPALKNIF